MWPGFWKASVAALAGYGVAVVMGLGIDFRFTLLAVPLLQIGWGAFGIVRLAQLIRRARRPAQAPEGGRESFGFALGGLLSSCILSLLLVVLTQAD